MPNEPPERGPVDTSSTPATGAQKSRRFQRSIVSARNVVASYAGTGGEAAVFLLLTPFMIRKLGLETYGLWVLTTALAEWLQLFDFGLREAVAKFAAAYQARSDARSVRSLAETALSFYLGMGCLALGAGVALTLLVLPRLLEGPSELHSATTALLILVASAAISLPANLAGGILEGLSRFDLLNLFRVGHALLRLVLIVVALQFDMGLVGLALAELVGRIALHACRWAAVYKIERNVIPRPRLHPEHWRVLRRFGFWNWIQQGSALLMARVYEPIIAVFTGLPAVGAFHAGRRLATIPAEAVVPMAGVLFPLSSEMGAMRRKEALGQTLLASTKVSTALAIPLTMVLAFGASPIQENWLGGDVPGMVAVLAVFSVYFLVEAIGHPASAILFGLGHVRLLALSAVVEFGVTLGLGIPLTSRMGPVGMAYAAVLGGVLNVSLVRLPMAAKRCGVAPSDLLRRSILPPALAAAPVALGMYLLSEPIAAGGLAGLFAWAGGGVGAFGALFWLLGLSTEDRKFLHKHLERLIRPVSEVKDWDDT